MRLDQLHKFSDNQNITANDTTVAAETTLDSGFINPNIGIGELGIMFTVRAADATLTSLKIAVWHGDSAYNEVVLVDSGAILLAILVKGYQLFLPYPNKCKRYRGVIYTVVGTSDNNMYVDCFETNRQ